MNFLHIAQPCQRGTKETNCGRAVTNSSVMDESLKPIMNVITVKNLLLLLLIMIIIPSTMYNVFSGTAVDG